MRGILLGFIATLCLFLAGCAGSQAAASQYASQSQRLVSEGRAGSTEYIVRDSKTGCEYLEFSDLHQGGITPLLDAQGRPAGCGTPR